MSFDFDLWSNGPVNHILIIRAISAEKGAREARKNRIDENEIKHI